MPALTIFRHRGSRGCTGRDSRKGGASGEKKPVTSPLRPWLCVHTVTVLPTGVSVKSLQPKVLGSKSSPVNERGKIKGFSHKAAARMRQFLLVNDVPGHELRNVTLTVPGEITPEEWRTALRRLSMIALRAGISFVWRVELQRRRVPHLHLVAWLPPKSHAHRVFTEEWLERCLPARCGSMPGALARAAHVTGPGSVGDVNWFAYLAAHATKSKKEQLGWKGKQWGIVGRGRFVDADPLFVAEFSDRQRAVFLRCLRRLLLGRMRVTSAKHGLIRFIVPDRVLRLAAWVRDEYRPAAGVSLSVPHRSRKPNTSQPLGRGEDERGSGRLARPSLCSAIPARHTHRTNEPIAALERYKTLPANR